MPSVAKQVAYWYCLKESDIEPIEFEDSFDHEDRFLMRPSSVKFFGRKQQKRIPFDWHPLSVITGQRSALTAQHLRDRKQLPSACLRWVESQLIEIVGQHDSGVKDLDERDLLRAGGALHKLGINLGPYRSRGLGCPAAAFQLCGYPSYQTPVEIEERSRGFRAPHHRAAKHAAHRLVVLCMDHNDPGVQRQYVDVIELRELSKMLKEVA